MTSAFVIVIFLASPTRTSWVSSQNPSAAPKYASGGGAELSPPSAAPSSQAISNWSNCPTLRCPADFRARTSNVKRAPPGVGSTRNGDSDIGTDYWHFASGTGATRDDPLPTRLCSRMTQIVPGAGILWPVLVVKARKHGGRSDALWRAIDVGRVLCDLERYGGIVTLGGTALNNACSPGVLPKLVEEAVGEALSIGFEFCVHPSTGRLLSVLASGAPTGGLIGETGTGFWRTAATWRAHALGPE